MNLTGLRIVDLIEKKKKKKKEEEEEKKKKKKKIEEEIENEMVDLSLLEPEHIDKAISFFLSPKTRLVIQENLAFFHI